MSGRVGRSRLPAVIPHLALTDEQRHDLDRQDYVVSAANAALGAIPFAGPLLVEIAGHVIPNQRIDRIARFAQELEIRLSRLESIDRDTLLEDDQFTDLVEEGLRQASRSLSDDRRQYIAGIIANGMSNEQIDFQESKHLLRILGEVSDVEIVWLHYYLLRMSNTEEEFYEVHDNVLERLFPSANSPPDEVDKAALQDSYKQHLARLGLLNPVYQTDFDTGDIRYHPFTNAPAIQDYQISVLGRLLLKQIGLAKEGAV